MARACDDIVETRALRRQQQEFQTRVDELRREVHQLSGSRQATVLQRHRLHIAEEILTLHCPKRDCRAAFLGFDGCFALSCTACGCGFCGWCLADCGRDAHAHVRSCVQNIHQGGIGGTQQEFAEVQNIRRQREVTLYLDSIDDLPTREELLEAIAGDLRDLGIQLPGGQQMARV